MKLTIDNQEYWTRREYLPHGVNLKLPNPDLMDGNTPLYKPYRKDLQDFVAANLWKHNWKKLCKLEDTYEDFRNAPSEIKIKYERLRDRVAGL